MVGYIDNDGNVLLKNIYGIEIKIREKSYLSIDRLKKYLAQVYHSKNESSFHNERRI